MTRKPYDERSNLVLQDVKDQTEGKYIAFISALGERSAVSFDSLAFAPGAVLFFRTSEKIAEKNGVMVAACPVDATWAVVDRERVLALTGAEWEEAKMADNKAKTAIFEKLFGPDKQVAQVAVLPNGEQVLLPATVEQKEAYQKVLTEPGETIKYRGGQYL